MQTKSKIQNIRQSCQKFVEKNKTWSQVFNSLSDENKNWVLGYLCGGKRVISYEKIKTHKDLHYVRKGKFFTKTEFYSLLKNEMISDDDYENVNFFLANPAS